MVIVGAIRRKAYQPPRDVVKKEKKTGKTNLSIFTPHCRAVMNERSTARC